MKDNGNGIVCRVLPSLFLGKDCRYHRWFKITVGNSSEQYIHDNVHGLCTIPTSKCIGKVLQKKKETQNREVGKLYMALSNSIIHRYIQYQPIE